MACRHHVCENYSTATPHVKQEFLQRFTPPTEQQLLFSAPKWYRRQKHIIVEWHLQTDTRSVLPKVFLWNWLFYFRPRSHDQSGVSKAENKPVKLPEISDSCFPFTILSPLLTKSAFPDICHGCWKTLVNLLADWLSYAFRKLPKWNVTREGRGTKKFLFSEQEADMALSYRERSPPGFIFFFHLENEMKFVFDSGAREERPPTRHLVEDAPDAPHVNRRRVFRRAEQHVGRPVPQRHHLIWIRLGRDGFSSR